ncbi:MAG: PqqD family protein [Bryobacteraceae bacterium]
MRPKARREQLATERLPDELIVYDLKRHKAHCLNRTAAYVWEHCDGLKDVPALARAISGEFGVPCDEPTVQLAVDLLREAELIEEEPPEGWSAISRRQAAGVAGAILLPAIATVMAPTPAMAQSTRRKTDESSSSDDIWPNNRGL